MKLIDKLNSIDKPKIEQLPQGKAITIENLWNDLIKKYLPDKETVIKWHDLLMEYIKLDKAVFAIRAFNSEKPEKYGDLRRGFLTQTSKDYLFFYTDNYFSAYFYKMAMDKFVPEFEEFCSLLYERKFPSRFRQITSLEREMMAVKMGRDPGINKAGFKLSHIMNVGKGYYYEQQKLSLVKKIVNKYFPRGERTDWRLVKQNEFESYYLRNLDVPQEARKFIVAQFLRLVHPLNMFLSPKRGCEKNSVCADIGEYDKLINYAYQYNMETYPEIYKEYLSLIMIDEDSRIYSDGQDIIDIEYGSYKKVVPKTKTDKEIRELEKKIKELEKRLASIREDKELIKKKENLQPETNETNDKYKISQPETNDKYKILQSETIQDYIKRLLKLLYLENLLTTRDIESLKDKEYCIHTFGINYPLLITDYRKIRDTNGHNRYWVNYILADKYYVCSQWWKSNFDLYKYNIYKWVDQIVNRSSVICE